MASIPACLLGLYTRRVIKTTPADKPALVRHLRRTMNNTPAPVLLPRAVARRRLPPGALQGEELRVAEPRLHLLYLHGGGYVAGVTRTYLNLCGHLAKELQANVLLPDYRKAPEHPWPAAVDDALAAWELLLARGADPRDIVVAGDSAGGGLALALLLRLRDGGHALPRCAIALSPYADMTATAASIRANDASDVMLSAPMLTVGRNIYVPDAAQERHPYASPAFGDYSGLPPLFLTVSEAECLRDDAYAVAARARAANVTVDLLARPDLPHVWPIFWPLLPEARADVARMVRFVRACPRPA